jgi:hypothetical protein
MACSFTIPFAGTAGSLIATIRNKILANNGSFGGDDATGSFSIQAIGATIEGSYAISGNEMMITIQRKPFFVSCNMIKDYVMDNLTGYRGDNKIK